MKGTETRKTRALFFEAPRSVAIREIELPPPGPNQVHGAWARLGREPGYRACSSTKARALEPFDPSVGVATYPTRYGYAWVGALEDGTRVFGLLPHGDAHVVDRASVRALPNGVPAARATLAANLETAITCAWDANVELGARVLVLGGGVVGVLTAWLLSRYADVTELVERRLATPPRGRGVARCTSPLLRPSPRDADVVVEATGDPAMLDVAIAHASARVVVASFYGRRRHPVDLGDAFHRKRLALVASQVSAIPPALAGRWDYARRFALRDRRSCG